MRAAIIVSALAMSISCDGSDLIRPGASHLSLFPDSITIALGETYQFEARARDAFGGPINVAIEYLASDSAVFAVNSTGTIVGRSVGSAQLVAAVGSLEARALVRVQLGPLGWEEADRGCGIHLRELYCWEIGPSDGAVSTPRPMRPDLQFSDVAAGALHHCAVDVEKQLWCWGSNRFGQLGTTSTDSAATPIPVLSGTRVSAVSAGPYNTCVISDVGSLWCWGANTTGQLGASPAEICGAFRVECSRTPLRLDLPGNVVSVAAGGDAQLGDPFEGSGHICAVLSTGKAYCSGAGGFGQLGTGSFGDSEVLRQVLGSSSYQQIAAGEFHTCAINKDSGAAGCWGINGRGELGLMNFPPGVGEACRSGDVVWECVSRPIAVSGSHTFRNISASQSTTCAVTKFSKILCWGEGRFGQLGDGILHTSAPYGSYIPVLVQSASNFVSVESDGSLVCGVTAAAKLYCWGNGSAQLRLMPNP